MTGVKGSTATRRALRADIESCGYFPELVEDAITLGVGTEELLDFVVHHQPTFTHDEVHRHITVLARTATRLVIGHTDDYPAEEAAELALGVGIMHELGDGQVRPAPDRERAPVLASTSTESVPLRRIATVALTRVVPHPEQFTTSAEAVETWLAIGWGAVRRVDIEPAVCPDPDCEADHGYSGALVADDLTMRMSSAADGADSVRRLVAFGTALQLVAGQ